MGDSTAEGLPVTDTEGMPAIKWTQPSAPRMGRLTVDQYRFLLAGVASGRVGSLRGMAHMEAWDIRRHLIRVFGFGGFDIETKALDLVAQIEIPPVGKDGKSRWTVIYRAEVRLTLKAADGRVLAVYEDGATGDSANQPSLGDAHDMAVKTALSQALKRSAVNLGDQFGLSLYNNASRDPVVLRTAVPPEGYQEGALSVQGNEDETVGPEPTPEPEEPPLAAEALLAGVAQATDRDALTRVWQRFAASGRAGLISAEDRAAFEAAWSDRRRQIEESEEEA